jgi:transglutaminase-like putative cysteine protease
MSTLFQIEHTTTYSYASPVTFGEHRLMFRPYESHDLRVVDASMDVSVRSNVRWIQDVFSNSVTIVAPRQPSDRLQFVCRITIEHFGERVVEHPLEPRAERLPVEYSREERLDLSPFIHPETEDWTGDVARWARGFLCGGDSSTREVLDAMMDELRDTFGYQSRDAEGTQAPIDTLTWRSGSCRDYAWLMIEALRRLGLACRFVSGYLYSPHLDHGGDARTGAGATHAWLEVYLPGAGWTSYDPTNRISGGTDLIRVAYARVPSQAAPISGSWIGYPSDYLGLDVDVQVRKTEERPDRALQTAT